jgi:DNA polymerase I-like protein with 3'-5' exonuclease and polymerase domains
MCIANEAVQHNVHTHQLAFVHDELQYETTPKHAEILMGVLENAAKLAGEYYNLRCPIAAESKQGTTWADVH